MGEHPIAPLAAASADDALRSLRNERNALAGARALLRVRVTMGENVQTFKAAVDTIVRDLHGSERIPGVDRITLPGERSEETRIARSRDGIPVAPALMRGLDQLADELGIAKLG